MAALIGLGVLGMFAPAAPCAVIDVDASQRGWILADGTSNGVLANNNYLAGNCGVSLGVWCGSGEYRNFFRFPIPDLPGTLLGASVIVNAGIVVAHQQPVLTYSVTSLGSSLTFGELGTGTPYGTIKLSAADNTLTREIVLNQAALSALRPNTPFAIGGRVTDPVPAGPAGPNEYAFAGPPGTTRLRITTLYVQDLQHAEAVEYHHATFDHYFVTALPEEIAALDSGAFAGWRRTGLSLGIWIQPSEGLSPVCRFFSTAFAPRSSHFYTPFDWECAIVKNNPSWLFETVAGWVALPRVDGSCPVGVPVYRVYNDGQGGAPNHRYTTSLAIRSAMLKAGWIAEGSGIGVIACTPY